MKEWSNFKLGKQVFELKVENGLLIVKDYDLENERISEILANQTTFEIHVLSVLENIVKNHPESFSDTIRKFRIRFRLFPQACTNEELLKTDSPLHLALGAFDHKDFRKFANVVKNPNTHPLTISYLLHHATQIDLLMGQIMTHPNFPLVELEAMRKSLDPLTLSHVQKYDAWRKIAKEVQSLGL